MSSQVIHLHWLATWNNKDIAVWQSMAFIDCAMKLGLAEIGYFSCVIWGCPMTALGAEGGIYPVSLILSVALRPAVHSKNFSNTCLFVQWHLKKCSNFSELPGKWEETPRNSQIQNLTKKQACSGSEDSCSRPAILAHIKIFRHLYASGMENWGLLSSVSSWLFHYYFKIEKWISPPPVILKAEFHS